VLGHEHEVFETHLADPGAPESRLDREHITGD
jgi:hypothetical protein